MSLAQGQWLTESGLQTFLGTQNLVIISAQNPGAVADNVPNIQSAINFAEARIISKLLTWQATPGVTFIKYPFTVANVSIGTATTSISYQTLTLIGNMFASRILGIWRQILSTPDEESGNAMAGRLSMLGKQGDDMLADIGRWVAGYTGGNASYLDLDLNTGAIIGAPCTTIQLPKFGRARVNPSGSPVQFVSDLLPWGAWPGGYGAYGWYPPFGCGGYGYGWW